jgi:hypothetical protein
LGDSMIITLSSLGIGNSCLVVSEAILTLLGFRVFKCL